MRGLWLSAGYVMVLLVLSPFVLLFVCLAIHCTQGIMVPIIALGCALAFLATLLSALLATFVFRGKSVSRASGPPSGR